MSEGSTEFTSKVGVELGRALSRLIREAGENDLPIYAAAGVAVSESGEVSCSLSSNSGLPPESVLLVTCEMLMQYIANKTDDDSLREELLNLKESLIETKENYFNYSRRISH